MHVRRTDMLGSKAPSDGNRRNVLQRAATNELRDTDRGQVTVQHGLDRSVLDEYLASLDDPGGQLSPTLHLGEVCVAQPTFAQRGAQEVGRAHRIGNRQVDADPAGR